jgi:hypothetical protein
VVGHRRVFILDDAQWDWENRTRYAAYVISDKRDIESVQAICRTLLEKAEAETAAVASIQDDLGAAPPGG